jgi:hypothetical protein
MSVGIPLDKVAPIEIVRLVLEAVEKEIEDVYPDAIAYYSGKL